MACDSSNKTNASDSATICFLIGLSCVGSNPTLFINILHPLIFEMSHGLEQLHIFIFPDIFVSLV